MDFFTELDPQIRLLPVPNFCVNNSNLKAAWDSVMEATSHGHPQSFQVAVTLVLEQLKREELKKQRKKD
jgi:hypothetical protein